ncbi:hypothetical protein D7X74_19880 [Corallococcus sp. CA047B]|uniref:hypothetical protein n=1 Tax=Corallococcus sp. CA047B TaxID=2316729 RepID=UPI000EA0BD6C|nr:hypothetical protein [Corallococcus sp. CA047B]RKH14515.1 hypothetical protein D7X74_19880 [Corallococcus sp. CA047B]
MRLNLKQWLSVLCVGAFAVAVPAWADVPTPVDCGTVECEGIREMKSLYTAEMAYFGERDSFTADMAQLAFADFAPAPCANGTRAPVPGPGWVSGCRFAYKVTAVTPNPSPSFTAVAQGAAGTSAAGITLQIGTHPVSGILFWLERNGVRRYVDAAECLAAQSFVCDAQLREGTMGLRALYTSEMAYFGEKDRYTSNYAQLGFLPPGCADGTRAPVPDASWIGGCKFIFRADVTGPSSFSLTARAVAGAIQGTVVTQVDQGEPVVTPVYDSVCR